MLLDYDIQLVAYYEKSEDSEYKIQKVEINQSLITLTEAQILELIEDIKEAEAFFEDEKIVVLESNLN
jgi:hypothetical protein